MSQPSRTTRKNATPTGLHSPSPTDQARAHALRRLVQSVHQRIQDENLRPQLIARHYIPRMDLYDDEQSPIVHALLELPGVTIDNIDVQVRDSVLVVNGRRGSPLLERLGRGGSRSDEPDDTTEPAFKVKELKFGGFCREINLPANCTTDHIRAEMTEGMLWLSWPRNIPAPRAAVPRNDTHAAHD